MPRDSWFGYKLKLFKTLSQILHILGLRIANSFNFNIQNYQIHIVRQVSSPNANKKVSILSMMKVLISFQVTSKVKHILFVIKFNTKFTKTRKLHNKGMFENFNSKFNQHNPMEV